jgi:hypothetical protein
MAQTYPADEQNTAKFKSISEMFVPMQRRTKTTRIKLISKRKKGIIEMSEHYSDDNY